MGLGEVIYLVLVFMGLFWVCFFFFWSVGLLYGGFFWGVCGFFVVFFIFLGEWGGVSVCNLKGFG